MTEEAPEVLEGQPCPFCNHATLTLMEQKKEIPYFGEVFVFSMSCTNCKYHKADLEAATPHEPARYTLEVSSEEDLKIRIVKASSATVKIPHITTIEPGEAANGYVTNVEGLIRRVKHAVEIAKEGSEEEEDVNKAKNMLKKINKVLFGDEKIKIIIEDPDGNSAIISEKAVKEPMKGKKKAE